MSFRTDLMPTSANHEQRGSKLLSTVVRMTVQAHEHLVALNAKKQEQRKQTRTRSSKSPKIFQVFKHLDLKLTGTMPLPNLTEENIMEKIHDTGFGNDFWNMTYQRHR